MRKISAYSLAAGLVLLALPAHSERVGNVGAVNPAAHGAPPGAAKHALSVGLGVENRERIETAGEGSAQIVFNDASTLTVGRNSAVTIDEFVYRGAGGSQGVSMTKGVMRFVGGGVSHESGANVRTPTASIGVRGGAAMVRIGGSCGTLVVHQHGKVDVAGAGNSQTLMRAGYGVCAPPGGPVSEPFLVPLETIAAMNAAMASRGGQNGGAKRKPTNQEGAFALGNDRPPSVAEPPGLEALNPFWAGNALVQSRANVDNQPAPIVPRHEHYDGGEGGGYEDGYYGEYGELRP